MYELSDTPEEITFDWLFTKINQEDVYFKYLGFYPDTKKKFLNPLRKDKKGDCKFYWDRGILYFKDWGWKAFTCVSVVMEIDSLNYYQALNKIYRIFIKGKKHIPKIITIEQVKSEKQKKKIDIKIQSFTNADKEYLKAYGITFEMCKFYRVFSIKHYWLDNELKYTYSFKNPCLGYYFKNGNFKLYHYLNDEFRFVSNTSHKDLQGYDQLNWVGKYLFITKSLKDVMLYRRLGFDAVAPHSETLAAWEEYIPILERRFETIIINFDNDFSDDAGIKATNKILKKYPQFQSFYVPLESKTKDLTDYFKQFKLTETKKILKHYESNNSI